MTDNEHVFKIITLGDSRVGKTSILKRFAHGIYEDNNLCTIGIGFVYKVISIDGKKIGLKIIDTAGQEKYRALAKSYYKNAQGALFVFSFDDKESFDHIQEWLNAFNDNGINDIPMFLVGNKCDVEQKVIDDNLIEELQKRTGLNNYKQTSAKENINIEELFNELSEKIYEQNKIDIEKKQIQKLKKLEDTKKSEEERNKKNRIKNCCTGKNSY